jgi:hypothetical protein
LHVVAFNVAADVGLERGLEMLSVIRGKYRACQLRKESWDRPKHALALGDKVARLGVAICLDIGAVVKSVLGCFDATKELFKNVI